MIKRLSSVSEKSMRSNRCIKRFWLSDINAFEEIKQFPYSNIRLRLHFERYPEWKDYLINKREMFELVDGDNHIALIIGNECYDNNGVFGFHIDKLEINKPFRGKGYAQILINYIVNLYKPNYLFLYARSYKLMYRYYLKNGFHRVGWRKVRKDL